MAKLAGIVLSVLLLSVIGFLPYHADAQTQTKYLLYQNKQYGFSIKYPSTWTKTETLTKDSTFPNMLNIVEFDTSSKLTIYGVSLIKDDTIFKGLSGQKFLDKIKEKFVEAMCSSALTGTSCSTKIVQQSPFTHQNGYKGYLTIFSAKISSAQGSAEPLIVMGFYPDGNDVWVIGIVGFSTDEIQQNSDVLASIGQSFTISNYKGEQSSSSSTSESSISTISKSSAGVLQINSGQFAASKYSPAELIVSGQINNYLKGVPFTLTIVKPDKTSEDQNILVTKDGNFRVPIKIDGTWPAGNYKLSANYGSQNLGSVSFQVNMGNTKTTSTPTPTQPTKYLLYENKQYGFSLKYPSDLKKEETLTKSDNGFPNSINLVSFTTPSELSTIGVTLIKDDTIFKGLSDQKFLDKMKNEIENRTCSAITDPTITCSMEVLDAQNSPSKNGYDAYASAYVFTISDKQNSQKLVVFIIMYPDGSDVWLLGLVVSPGEQYQDIGQEVGKMADTFTISNYKGVQKSSSISKSSTTQTIPALKQKQFQLDVKASQKDDVVTITILNPKDSSTDVYSIKLTTVNGKIKNYLKVDGWDYKRTGDNTVMYQTKLSPLKQSNVITIKLKVDTKNTEIKWEAFSKDQKSLGSGKVKSP